MISFHAPECLAVAMAIWTAPTPFADFGVEGFCSLLIADTYGNVLVVVVVAAFLAGVVGLWFASRVTPKGTVLAIAVGIYVVSWLIRPGDVRELHGLVGMLRLLGFAALVLGAIDLVRKRK